MALGIEIFARRPMEMVAVEGGKLSLFDCSKRKSTAEVFWFVVLNSVFCKCDFCIDGDFSRFFESLTTRHHQPTHRLPAAHPHTPAEHRAEGLYVLCVGDQAEHRWVVTIYVVYYAIYTSMSNVLCIL